MTGKDRSSVLADMGQYSGVDQFAGGLDKTPMGVMTVRRLFWEAFQVSEYIVVICRSSDSNQYGIFMGLDDEPEIINIIAGYIVLVGLAACFSASIDDFVHGYGTLSFPAFQRACCAFQRGIST